jgi:hypothetical protein
MGVSTAKPRPSPEFREVCPCSFVLRNAHRGIVAARNVPVGAHRKAQTAPASTCKLNEALLEIARVRFVIL